MFAQTLTLLQHRPRKQLLASLTLLRHSKRSSLLQVSWASSTLVNSPSLVWRYSKHVAQFVLSTWWYGENKYSTSLWATSARMMWITSTSFQSKGCTFKSDHREQCVPHSTSWYTKDLEVQPEINPLPQKRHFLVAGYNSSRTWPSRSRTMTTERLHCCYERPIMTKPALYPIDPK